MCTILFWIERFLIEHGSVKFDIKLRRVIMRCYSHRHKTAARLCNSS